MFQEILYTTGLISIVIALIVLPFYFRTRKKVSLSPTGVPQSMGMIRTMEMSEQSSSPRILPIMQESFPSQSFDDRDTYDFTLEIKDLPSDEDLTDWVPDAESVLMKEAEDTVEKIQTVLDNIASYPANPEEVFSKIQAVVSGQKLFINTEYYDAINHFIMVAVKRDAKIEFTEKEVASLWKD
jgi:succinate dehydrogenase flavin-adding protein (antitoxin of CptAB toxin-antitoxin module)